MEIFQLFLLESSLNRNHQLRILTGQHSKKTSMQSSDFFQFFSAVLNSIRLICNTSNCQEAGQVVFLGLEDSGQGRFTNEKREETVSGKSPEMGRKRSQGLEGTIGGRIQEMKGK